MVGSDSMQKNSTQLIQKYFFDYLICEDGFQKQNTIDQCIKKLPEQKNLIYRLKNIIDELHGNAAKSFVNNVFDVRLRYLAGLYANCVIIPYKKSLYAV